MGLKRLARGILTHGEEARRIGWDSSGLSSNRSLCRLPPSERGCWMEQPSLFYSHPLKKYLLKTYYALASYSHEVYSLKHKLNEPKQ